VKIVVHGIVKLAAHVEPTGKTTMKEVKAEMGKFNVKCEEGGCRKAKCDGRCIENGVVCVHLILELKEDEK
jgi:hypothetical protein